MPDRHEDNVNKHTNAQMRVDCSKEGCSDPMKVVLLVRNMRRGPRVSKLFSQPEIDDVDHVRRLACAHDEIGRLDITVHD